MYWTKKHNPPFPSLLCLCLVSLNFKIKLEKARLFFPQGLSALGNLGIAQKVLKETENGWLVVLGKLLLYCVSFSLSAGRGQLQMESCQDPAERHRVVSVALCNDDFYVEFCISTHTLRKLLMTLCACVHCPLLTWHLISLSKPLIFVFQNSSKFVGKERCLHNFLCCLKLYLGGFHFMQCCFVSF